MLIISQFAQIIITPGRLESLVMQLRTTMSYVSTMSDLQKSKMTREKTEQKKTPQPKTRKQCTRKTLAHYAGREAK